MLRPGSRYRPKAHRAASQNGMSKRSTRALSFETVSNDPKRRLSRGASKRTSATHTASSAAMTSPATSAPSVAPILTLDGRLVLTFPTFSERGAPPA